MQGLRDTMQYSGHEEGQTAGMKVAGQSVMIQCSTAYSIHDEECPVCF